MFLKCLMIYFVKGLQLLWAETGYNFIWVPVLPSVSATLVLITQCSSYSVVILTDFLLSNLKSQSSFAFHCLMIMNEKFEFPIFSVIHYRQPLVYAQRCPFTYLRMNLNNLPVKEILPNSLLLLHVHQ
jgi:hypothetical protein